jgi:hypothetical protein
MSHMRYRVVFGLLTGCLAVLGACALDPPQQSSERTGTVTSAVLVQSCGPEYGSCADWSTPSQIGSPECSYGTGQCGYYCDPLPGRPDYCDQQIIPTDECCNWLPNNETVIIMQSYQDCWDIHGNNCVNIDQSYAFAGCSC